LRRAEGGAKCLGVFRVKNHDFTPKNHILFILRREARNLLGYFVWKITILRQKIMFFPILGGRAPGAPPPPLDPPLAFAFCSGWLIEPRQSCQSGTNRIGGVMVSVLVSCAVDRGFEPRSGQTKDYKIGICCLSAKHAALRRKTKDWLAWNKNNMSEWSDTFTHGLLFQWASTKKIQLSVLV
jgi:hypothetical protein